MVLLSQLSKMNQDLLNDLINALTILPGVGKKSAQRMALYLLDKNKDGASILAKTMLEALENVNRCKRCRMLTSNEYCKVCADTSRDSDSVCVVESPSDVLAIESTGGFRGKYFVLLGRLSPIEGVSPEDLGIDNFLNLIKTEKVKEVILATSATVEGQTTAYYIQDSLAHVNVKITKLAQGLPVGGEIESLDDGTLFSAFKNRLKLKSSSE